MGIDIAEIEDFSHYKYYRYLSGRNVPDVAIRVLIDKDGLPRGAETIDPLTGRFKNSTGMLTEIWDGLYIEESSEEEFIRLCHRAIEEAGRIK